MAKKIRQAVILAGGLGMRMRPLTLHMPKPMVPINERPFLEYLIDLLRENGIKEVILLLGYLPDKVTEYFGDGKRFGMEMRYSITAAEDDTGTRLKKAEALLDEDFLLLYSDNYLPFNLQKLVDAREKIGTRALVTVYSNKDEMTKNNILVDDAGVVIKYDKTRTDPDLNGVDAGFFLLDKKVLELASTEDFSFEKEIVMNLIARKEMGAYMTDQRYYSIGSIERLPTTERFLKPKKVVLLDRDGVINKKSPKADYVKNWKEFKFLPGAIDGLVMLSERGYEIYIITNQPGVARGLMTKEDVDTIHANMRGELARHSVIINGIYVCFHGWDEGCECRKPKPGLLYQASREHFFDLTKAVMMGDDDRDGEAAKAAGAKFIPMESDSSLFDVVKSSF
jgi:D-glycero-D-manno-heptose 1,7-bisphosphate phosphatase